MDERDEDPTWGMGKMNRAQVEQWESCYNNAYSIYCVLHEQLADQTGELLHKNILPTMAAIMVDQHEKEEFDGDEQHSLVVGRHCGDHYRWRYEIKGMLQEGLHYVGCYPPDTVPINIVDTRDSRVVLELAEYNFARDESLVKCGNSAVRWKEWICIKRSEHADGELGVFTCRQLAKGVTVGCFIGEVVSRDEEAGGDIDEKGPSKQDGEVHIRDHEGFVVTIKPEKRQEWVGSAIPFFLGCHYLRDATNGVNPGSKVYNASRRANNCILCVDGTVQTLKKIDVGEELLCCYDRKLVPARAAFAKVHLMNDRQTTGTKEAARKKHKT